jgi:hypothetical protein
MPTQDPPFNNTGAGAIQRGMSRALGANFEVSAPGSELDVEWLRSSQTSGYAIRAISRYRQNALASSICRGVLHRTWNGAGLATTAATHRAREIARLKWFSLNTHSIPLGYSNSIARRTK